MGKFLLQDVYVVINSTNLSDHGFNVDISLQKDKIDVSGFSSTNSKEYLPGDKDEEFTIQFLQDFDANKVDAILWPLYDSGTPFPFELRPTSGTPTSTNPRWYGTATLYEYHPLNGAKGARSETSVNFAIQGGVQRGTS